MKSITMMVMTICRVAGCVNRQSQRQMPQSPCTLYSRTLCDDDGRDIEDIDDEEGEEGGRNEVCKHAGEPSRN